MLCNTDQDLLRVANPPSQVAHVAISLDNLRGKFYTEPISQSVLDMSSQMALERMISSLHLMYSIHNPLCVFTVPLYQTTKRFIDRGGCDIRISVAAIPYKL